MSYIEDRVWRNNAGTPIMTIPADTDYEFFDDFLAILEMGWCESCQNPAIRWVLYDTAGEARSQSIGAHTTMDAAIEDILHERDCIS